MWYDSAVAKRRNYGRNSGNWNQDISPRPRSGVRYSRKRGKAKFPGTLVFWAAFLVVIAGLFFMNRDQIRQSLESISSTVSPEGRSSGGTEQPPAEPAAVERAPVAEQPLVTAPRPIEQRNTAPVAVDPPAPAANPASTPPAGRLVPSYTDQALYFIRVSDDGDIIRSRVARRIPVSGTPLQDTLEVLVAGPNSGELGQGMLSLIPPDTRILSAVIEGNTARVNFSEEFQYNTAGPEGFIAQLIQIIWTATEFPNVQNVQILIEGNRIDHLGEGIPIWNPLNRQSFNQ
jgi:spore germination protein GerM